jgi:hypothetical protein
MPRGAKLGKRRGSRQLTAERYVRSAQVAARQKDKEGPKLGKEVIEHFMKLAMRNAIACKPTEDDLTPSQNTAVQGRKDWKLDQFKGWAKLAVAWASELAPYQSARYRAISKAPQPDQGDKDRGTRVLHSLEEVEERLISRGITLEQFGRALMEPTMEHEQTADKR